MKALILAFTLFAGASVTKIAFDIWDTIIRPEDCLAFQATTSRQSGLIYEGRIPCPIEK